jgi:hypothetical protein
MADREVEDIMDKITYSSDTGEETLRDHEITSKMAEDYFGTDTDPEQMRPSDGSRKWMLENARGYNNIIRHKRDIVGYSFMLPCSIKLMEQFLSGAISEFNLFEQIKKTKFGKCPESIYLCTAFIKPEFRRRGFVTTAYVKAIKKATSNYKYKPILFYWKYTEEGEKIALKVAKLTGLKLRKKN